MRSVQHEVNRHVFHAFDMLGDLIQRAEYTRVTGVSYDPATRAVAPSTSTHLVRVAMVKVQTTERADHRPVQRRSALLPAGDLGDVQPRVTDALTVEGVTYNVTEIRTDPTSAIHRLELVML